jgi:mannosyltransferase OCH1-like enzyme
VSIPRVFHQVWINDHQPELPEQFRRYRDGWLEKHPHWEYRLWNLKNLPFRSRHADLLARSKVPYAQIADVLRYEILYELGGVYLDTDFECLRPIDDILKGVTNFACSDNGKALTNAILGAEKSSTLMFRCVCEIPSRLGHQSPNVETGPTFFTRVVLRHGFHNDLTVFPTKWFYPYKWNEPHRANETFPESYGVHRWAHSWKAQDRTIMARLRRRLYIAFNVWSA